jgi:hypothetical protein
MLVKWATVVGLVLTAAGILIGFYWPTVATRWSGPETLAHEYWLQMRFVIGLGLVLIGTLLQVYAAWPRR